MSKVDLVQLPGIGVVFTIYEGEKIVWGGRKDYELIQCSHLAVERVGGGIVIETRFRDDDPGCEMRRLWYAGPYLVEEQ